MRVMMFLFVGIRPSYIVLMSCSKTVKYFTMGFTSNTPSVVMLQSKAYTRVEN
jgi:hypothetical protein